MNYLTLEHDTIPVNATGTRMHSNDLAKRLQSEFPIKIVWFRDPTQNATDSGPNSPPPDPTAEHMLMIGDWGTDKYLGQQIAVRQKPLIDESVIVSCAARM